MSARSVFPSTALLTILALMGLTGAGAADAQSTPKIAVIDVQRILGESQAGKQAQTEIDALRQQKTESLQAMQQEVSELQKRLTEGRLSLSEDKLAELQEEYEQKAINLRRAADDAEREVNKRSEQLLNDIERRILPVINEIGREGSYTLIFRKFGSGLVYADTSIDITAQVVERLNARDSAADGR